MAAPATPRSTVEGSGKPLVPARRTGLARDGQTSSAPVPARSSIRATLTTLVGGLNAAFAMNSSGVIAGGDANQNINGTGAGAGKVWYYDGAVHNPDDSYICPNGSGASPASMTTAWPPASSAPPASVC